MCDPRISSIAAGLGAMSTMRITALLGSLLLLLGVAVGEISEATLDIHDLNTVQMRTSKYSNYMRPRERRLEETIMVWCIARTDASDVDLQNALDWACGPLAGQGHVNCGPISVDGACFDPDTTAAHSSYSFNEYFIQSNASLTACNFTNSATITTIDPSHGTCEYPGSNVPVDANLTRIIGALPPSGSPMNSPAPAPQSDALGFEPSYLFCVSTVLTLITYFFT